MEKKLDGNYTGMLWAILNKSWRQHPTNQQLYSYLPPITKTIKIRWTRYAGHCWRIRDELTGDVFLWTPSHEWAKAGRPPWTYIQRLCADTDCSLEDLPQATDNREMWRERVRNIRADSVIWWWWWCIYVIMVWRLHIWYFLIVVRSESRCIFAFRRCSTLLTFPCFFFSVFLLCSFHSHILLENCFVSLPSSCWYVFVHSSLIFW